MGILGERKGKGGRDQGEGERKGRGLFPTSRLQGNT